MDLTPTGLSTPCRSSHCKICPHVIKAKSFHHNNETIRPNKTINCHSKNTIYLLTCSKCPTIYIGQSINFRHRFWNHKNRIQAQKKTTPLIKHFNSPHHSFQDLKIFFLEEIPTENNNPQEIKNKLDQRESFWIQKLKSYQKGLNAKPGPTSPTPYKQLKITHFFNP